MNQAEIRFFVSTINAVENAIPSSLDLSKVIERLNNLLKNDKKISKKSCEIIENVISELDCDFCTYRDKLDELLNELYPIIPEVVDSQAWRYEPYPWLGAPASPLLPLFSF